jgi:hypothetical protein
MINQAKKYIYWTSLLLVICGSIFQSCLKSKKPGIPLDVVDIIQNTGFNRVELTKTIAKYFESGDSLKLQAAYFLIRNMKRQYSVEYQLIDSNENIIEINPLDFADEESFLKYWDSLETNTNGLVFNAKKYMLDRDTITYEILTSTIEKSIEARNYPWAKGYDNNIFFKYVLPYRIGNEHIEDWRSFLMQEFSWIEDSAGKDAKADNVAQIVNNYVNRNFSYDLRHLKNPHEQKLEDLFANKNGNYRDLSFLKARILRSLGIPATVDYIPYLSDSVHSFHFAVYFDDEGNFKPLLDPETENLIYDETLIPKVYRRIYHTIDSSLFAIKDLMKTTPPYLGHYDYLDVTEHYVPVQEIIYEGFCPDTLIYLSVFNDKKWRATDWAICKNNKAVFKNISRGVNYRFSWLEDESSVNQLILPKENSIE